MGEPKQLTWQELGARQAEVLGWRQAQAAGLTQAAWDWRLRRGLWQTVVPGVAALHSGHLDVEQLRWAAVIHGGTDAALAGDAALVFFGVRRVVPSTYDIAIPKARRVVPVVADALTITPRRVTGLPRHAAGHPHLRLVHVTASALYAAAWAASDEIAEERLTMVVQQRKTTAAALRSVLEDLPRLHRRALMLEVLHDIEHGAHATSELDYLRFCRRNRLPAPDEMQLCVRAGGYRYLDARYRGPKVRVEVDGAHHMWVEQWNADAMRELQLVVAARGTGEQSIRITRAMMRHHEPETAALMRTLLVP